MDMKALIKSKEHKASFLDTGKAVKATPRTVKATVFNSVNKKPGFIAKRSAAVDAVKARMAGGKPAKVFATVKPVVTLAKPVVVNVRLEQRKATRLALMKKHGLI
jgi:hypothetical protein